ncbi:helix-turn-helix domain-containing protein [Actinokineospora fastidiosa]|nr:helix-turn-helix domain-containing protein [Actinokineospora fastidiosa]
MPAGERRADAVIEVLPGSGRPAVFAVEAKSNPRSSMSVVNQALAFSKRGTLPVLIITEYANPALRAACEANAIGYLDPTGWAYLTHDDPPILIRLEGARKPPHAREDEKTTRLNGPAAGRAIRCLLETVPPVGVRDLAARSSSSPAAVSKLMPALVESGAIERDSAGAVTHIRRRTLLDRWCADYAFTRSNGPVLAYLAPRGLPRLLSQLRNRGDAVSTGSAAARAYLPPGTESVVPLTVHAMYAMDPRATAARLGLVPTDRPAANVLIATSQDQHLDRYVRRSEDGLTVAPLGQVLADLLTLPGRLAQEADHLMHTLARTDPTWSE